MARQKFRHFLHGRRGRAIDTSQLAAMEDGTLLAASRVDGASMPEEARMTLVCQLCKMVQGDMYRIAVSGMDDLVMCNHVVESVVETYRLVEAPELERVPKAA
jgi:hypothetical protein